MRILYNNTLVFLCFVALAFILFGNGMGGDFVFDDRAVITGNPLVEDASGMFEAFLRPYHYARPQSGLYRPLTFASFVFDWHLFSGDPAGFHVVNILLHAAAVFLIFMVTLNLSAKGGSVSGGKDRTIAFISSLIFLFLPIHVESVTSIVGRGELLMFTFSMGAFYSIQKDYYKTAALFFFLSLLSKETGIALVPVFIFYEFFWKKNKELATSTESLGGLKRRQETTPRNGRGISDVNLRTAGELFKKSVYFLLPLAFYAALRYNALGSEYFINTNAYSFFNPIKTLEFFPGLWTAFKVLYLYTQKVIFPTYFSSDYSYNQIAAVNNLFDSWHTMVGVGIFAAAIYLSVSKRNSLIGLGFVIFLFSYLVVSNLFVKIGTTMAERLMYMPSFGFVLIASGFLSDMLKNHKKSAKLLWAGLVLLLAVYSVQIIKGNALWKNEKTLFENAYEYAPNSVVNITNVASILFREGNNEEALEKIELALEIEPKNSPTLHLAGQIYDSMGDERTAEEFWQRAILAQPDYLYPYLSLGALYYQKGDFRSGKEILIRAKEVYNTPNVVTLLSFNKIGLGEHREVIGLIKEKFGAKPKIYELRFVLGVAYLMSGDDLTARELLMELKDPALNEEVFFQNLKNTKIFNVEI